MSPENRSQCLRWVISASFLLAVAVTIFYVLHAPSRQMKALIETKVALAKHELNFLTRTRDAVKYRVRLTASDGTVIDGIYRIPAVPDNLPVVIYLYSASDDQLLAAVDSVNGFNTVGVFAINTESILGTGNSFRSLSSSKALEALTKGVIGVTIASQYLYGHNLVDTSKIFVAGDGTSALICLPSLSVIHSHLTGGALISPPKINTQEIADPVSWARMAGNKRVLLAVVSGEAKSKSIAINIAKVLTGKPEVVDIPAGGSSLRRALEATRSWLTDIGAVPSIPQPTPVGPGQQPSPSDKQRTFRIG